LPKNHPERAIFEDLLKQARRASRGIKNGTLKSDAADKAQADLTRDLTRHSNESELFAALMNTDPLLLTQHRSAIRRRLGHDLDVATTHAQSQSETQAANRGSGRGRDPLGEVEPRSPIETDLLGGIDMSVVDSPGRRQQPIHFDTGVFSHTYAEALVPGLPRGLDAEVKITFPDGSVGRADRVHFITDEAGDVIGAHVFEIKPNVGDNVARGEEQVARYLSGIRAQIEAALTAKGKPIPTPKPGDPPLYRGQVLTYDFDQMMAVLRALRGSRRDAARMAELEGIARKVFAGDLTGKVTGPPAAAGHVTGSAGHESVPESTGVQPSSRGDVAVPHAGPQAGSGEAKGWKKFRKAEEVADLERQESGEFIGGPVPGPDMWQNFRAARISAATSAGLGADQIPFSQKAMGPAKEHIAGRQVGYASPDGSRGWRLDFDPASNKDVHLNWWRAEDGVIYRGHLRVASGEASFLQLLAKLPQIGR
jgi:hypothetical protein